MIETARKEDLFLDKKLIIPENRLDAIRIMARLHPVVGDQPTNEKDQPNTNNPVLDLACTILNIHESGIGVHADLRKIQNEPPKYFYGKGFMSGISSLKGNGILAVYGQWRDASGRYAIKQFYYTDKEILWRNAVSDTAWSAWFDVLTGNSDLDYNKLLNVPITSTLSDSKTQIASIFAVNNVNRAVVTAQKTANTANENAVDAMNEAKKKRDQNDGGFHNQVITITGTTWRNSIRIYSQTDEQYVRLYTTNIGRFGLYFYENGKDGSDYNYKITFPYENGEVILDTRITSTLTDDKEKIASIFSVNTVNRVAVNAQKTANTANANAVDAMNEAKKKRNSNDHDFSGGSWASGINLYRSEDSYSHYHKLMTYSTAKGSFAIIGYEVGNQNFDHDYIIIFPKTSGTVLTTGTTTVSKKGFLRFSGSMEPLTEDQLTSTLQDSNTLVATIGAVNNVNRTAKNAEKIANNAFSKVKPISEGGTGATTAANARKNLGHGDASTRNVATSINSNGNTLVPLSLLNNSMFGVGQKWIDVTSKRVSGSEYSSGSKTIFLSLIDDGGGGGKNLTLYIDGVIAIETGGTSNSEARIYVPIPPNSKYKVLGKFNRWSEFR